MILSLLYDKEHNNDIGVICTVHIHKTSIQTFSRTTEFLLKLIVNENIRYWNR